MLAIVATGCTPAHRLQQFRAVLTAHQSATVALEQWCAARHIASPARIEAITLNDADPGTVSAASTPAIRAALALSATEPLRLRHVQLTCGTTVLSDARNWYVPARLTPAMSHTLDTTRTPFGKVIASLGIHRHPLPATMPTPARCPAHTIEHVTAVLRRDDGQPISLVSECYTRANIAGR